MTLPIAAVLGMVRGAAKKPTTEPESGDSNDFGMALGLAISGQPTAAPAPVISLIALAVQAQAGAAAEAGAANAESGANAASSSEPPGGTPLGSHSAQAHLVLELAQALRENVPQGLLAAGGARIAAPTKNVVGATAASAVPALANGNANATPAAAVAPVPDANAGGTLAAAAAMAAAAVQSAERAALRSSQGMGAAKASAPVAPAKNAGDAGKNKEAAADGAGADASTARSGRKAASAAAKSALPAPAPVVAGAAGAAASRDARAASAAASDLAHRVELETPASGSGSEVVPRDLSDALDAATAAPRRALDQVTLPFEGENGLEGRLRIALRGNALHATIVTPDAEAAARIEGAMGELHRALMERGFGEVKLAVQHAPAAAPTDVDRARSDSRSSEQEHESSRQQRAAREEERARSSNQQSRRGPKQGRQEG
jgi:hypothetical protein